MCVCVCLSVCQPVTALGHSFLPVVFKFGREFSQVTGWVVGVSWSPISGRDRDKETNVAVSSINR